MTGKRQVNETGITGMTTSEYYTYIYTYIYKNEGEKQNA